MESLQLDREFDLVIIPFNTFLHNLKLEEQISTMENIREHLKSGGKLLLDFYIPDFEKVAEGTGEGSRSTETVMIEGEIFERVTKVEWIDEVEQIRSIRNELFDPEGEKVWESEFKMKIISKREFELLLKIAGFEEWKIYQGFDREELEEPCRSVWIVEN